MHGAGKCCLANMSRVPHGRCAALHARSRALTTRSHPAAALLCSAPTARRDARLELNTPWQQASAAALLLPELRAALVDASPLAPGSWEEVIATNHLAQAVHNRAFAVLQVRMLRRACIWLAFVAPWPLLAPALCERVLMLWAHAAFSFERAFALQPACAIASFSLHTPF